MKPDPDSLPFLVVHGAIVWKVLLVLLTLVGVAAVVVVRSLWARREVRRALAPRVESATTKLHARLVVLRGTLRGGEAITLAVRTDELTGDDELLRSAHTGAPWLDVGGTRVELDGQLVVRAGARVVARWRRPPADTPATLLDPERDVKIRRAQLRRVPDGTPVIAEGVLAQRAGTEETGYREAAGGWSLGADGDAPVRLEAISPASRPPALGPPLYAVIALASLGCTFGLLRFVGKRAVAKLEDRSFPEDGRPVALSNLDAYSIGAAMPGSRAKALEYLDDDLERHGYHDTASFRRRLAVTEMRSGCAGVRQLLYAAERYDDALAVAQRCGKDPTRELYALGRYDELAAQLTREGTHDPYYMPVAISAGDWALAAAMANEGAADATQPYEVGTDDKLVRHRKELRYRCLSAVFAERAGGPAAAPTLAEVGAQDDGEGCQLVAAAVGPIAQRREALEALIAAWGPQSDHDYSLSELLYLAYDLAWSEGAVLQYRDDSFYEPASALTGDEDFEQGWLAPWAELALRENNAPARQLAVAHAWEAVIAVVAGDPRATEQQLAEVTRLSAANEYEVADASDFASAVALHGDRVDLPPARLAGVDDQIRIRRGEGEPQYPGLYPEACEPDYIAAVHAAQAGDGASLGNVLQRCHVFSHSFVDDVLAVLPRIDRDRAAMSEPVRWADLDGFDYKRPFSAASHAAIRRDLDALAGNTEDAARWQAIAAAHVAPLRDHDRVVALLLWDP